MAHRTVQFSLANLEKIAPAAAMQFQELLEEATEDCRRRKMLTTARKVNMVVEMTPKVRMDRSGPDNPVPIFEGVEMDIHFDPKIPKRSLVGIDAVVMENGSLLVNPDSLASFRQMSLPGVGGEQEE